MAARKRNAGGGGQRKKNQLPIQKVATPVPQPESTPATVQRQIEKPQQPQQKPTRHLKRTAQAIAPIEKAANPVPLIRRGLRMVRKQSGEAEAARIQKLLAQEARDFAAGRRAPTYQMVMRLGKQSVAESLANIERIATRHAQLAKPIRTATNKQLRRIAKVERLVARHDKALRHHRRRAREMRRSILLMTQLLNNDRKLRGEPLLESKITFKSKKQQRQELKRIPRLEAAMLPDEVRHPLAERLQHMYALYYHHGRKARKAKATKEAIINKAKETGVPSRERLLQTHHEQMLPHVSQHARYIKAANIAHEILRRAEPFKRAARYASTDTERARPLLAAAAKELVSRAGPTPSIEAITQLGAEVLQRMGKVRTAQEPKLKRYAEQRPVKDRPLTPEEQTLLEQRTAEYRKANKGRSQQRKLSKQMRRIRAIEEAVATAHEPGRPAPQQRASIAWALPVKEKTYYTPEPLDPKAVIREARIRDTKQPKVKPGQSPEVAMRQLQAAKTELAKQARRPRRVTLKEVRSIPVLPTQALKHLVGMLDTPRTPEARQHFRAKVVPAMRRLTALLPASDLATVLHRSGHSIMKKLIKSLPPHMQKQIGVDPEHTRRIHDLITSAVTGVHRAVFTPTLVTPHDTGRFLAAVMRLFRGQVPPAVLNAFGGLLHHTRRNFARAVHRRAREDLAAYQDVQQERRRDYNEFKTHYYASVPELYEEAAQRYAHARKSKRGSHGMLGGVYIPEQEIRAEYRKAQKQDPYFSAREKERQSRARTLKTRLLKYLEHAPHFGLRAYLPQYAPYLKRVADAMIADARSEGGRGDINKLERKRGKGGRARTGRRVYPAQQRRQIASRISDLEA